MLNAAGMIGMYEGQQLFFSSMQPTFCIKIEEDVL
jgi:hypothetical protein